jgi:hypothetical protein
MAGTIAFVPSWIAADLGSLCAHGPTILSFPASAMVRLANSLASGVQEVAADMAAAFVVLRMFVMNF